MKLGYNRETIIGLSLLLVLCVVLVVVAARRFMHRGDRQEVAALATEAKAEWRDHEERAREEVRAEKPILNDSPAAAVAEGEHKHDSQVRWETHAEEHHEDKAHPGHELALAEIPAHSPKLERSEHHDVEAEHKAHEHVEAASAGDRYAVPVADRYAIPPTPEHIHSGETQPTVIQVSGDDPDRAARRDEGRESERRAESRDGAATLRTDRAESLKNRGEMNRFEHRESPPPEAAGQYASGPPVYGARDLRSGYDPVAGRPPMESGPQGYPGPEAAYGRENGLRHEERHEEMRADEMRSGAAQLPLRNDGQYEVQPNDSYWAISERVYGSGAYFRALAEVNRGKAARPDRLTPGLLIATPPAAQLEKDYPDFCPRQNRRETVRNRPASTASMAGYAETGRTYTVQEGDTLSSIARNELGKVTRWAEIYQLNRDVLGKDYDYLTPGLRLAMPRPASGYPDGAGPDRTTRRPDDAPPYMR